MISLDITHFPLILLRTMPKSLIKRKRKKRTHSASSGGICWLKIRKKKEIWWDRVDLSRGPIKKPERICRHLDERIHFGNFDKRNQKILKEGERHPIQDTLKSLSPIAGSSNYVTMAKKKKKENSSEFMFLAGPTRMWNSWLLCSSIEEMAPARMQKEARAAAS